jgi:hypothetical protein
VCSAMLGSGASYWKFKCPKPMFVIFFLHCWGMELRTLHMAGKHSITKLYLQPNVCLFVCLLIFGGKFSPCCPGWPEVILLSLPPK